MGVFQEIKKIIDSAYKEAKQILSEHRDKLDKVAEVLVEKEKITGEIIKPCVKRFHARLLAYSTVTDFARFRGLSTSQPLPSAI